MTAKRRNDERACRRLEGPLAVLARELGVGVWDEAAQSISVEASRVEETKALLAEIAKGDA